MEAASDEDKRESILEEDLEAGEGGQARESGVDGIEKVPSGEIEAVAPNDAAQ